VELKIIEGEVDITGNAADIFFATEIVKAIGRGFEPRKALLLLKEDFMLHLIHLRELASTEKAIVRLKGRVIGEDGRIKTMIEESTDCFLSVYGNTIGIIAKSDTIEYTKEAVSMILNGSRHSSVLSYLSKSKRKILESRFRS
jgi:ribosomal RNA assembly protein